MGWGVGGCFIWQCLKHKKHIQKRDLQKRKWSISCSVTAAFPWERQTCLCCTKRQYKSSSLNTIALTWIFHIYYIIFYFTSSVACLSKEGDKQFYIHFRTQQWCLLSSKHRCRQMNVLPDPPQGPFSISFLLNQLHIWQVSRPMISPLWLQFLMEVKRPEISDTASTTAVTCSKIRTPLDLMLHYICVYFKPCVLITVLVFRWTRCSSRRGNHGMEHECRPASLWDELQRWKCVNSEGRVLLCLFQGFLLIHR